MKFEAPKEPIVPFLKWAGGKQWLAQYLIPFIVPSTGKYIEPFLGGGSVYFSVLPQRACLSDSNRDLVETYQAIKREARAVADRLRKFTFTKDCYYRVRSSNPRSSVGKAARLIYLNRTCWNGLYRVNREGKFNVPMGSFGSAPDFLVTDRLMAAQRALKSATILCQDFEGVIESAERGDTVYLDPPYTVAHNNNGFLRYNDLVFSWSDQKRLAATARKLRDRGCKVVLSNADHPSITELYDDFVITKLQRKSLVAGEKTKRRSITELLITSFSLKK